MPERTHIQGVIVLSPNYNAFTKIPEILGPEATEETVDDECTLPSGSNGSLRYRVSTGGISFQGDLIDYGVDDIPRFMEWLKNLTGTLKLGGHEVQEVIASAIVEHGSCYIAAWDWHTKRICHWEESRPLRYERLS